MEVVFVSTPDFAGAFQDGWGKAVLRMKYLTQTGTCPPHFTFFVNRPDVVDDNYERYLENRMREAFPLEGTPIRLKFKKKD